jgi:hypothetical protein
MEAALAAVASEARAEAGKRAGDAVGRALAWLARLPGVPTAAGAPVESSAFARALAQRLGPRAVQELAASAAATGGGVTVGALVDAALAASREAAVQAASRAVGHVFDEAADAATAALRDADPALAFTSVVVAGLAAALPPPLPGSTTATATVTGGDTASRLDPAPPARASPAATATPLPTPQATPVIAPGVSCAGDSTARVVPPLQLNGGSADGAAGPVTSATSADVAATGPQAPHPWSHALPVSAPYTLPVLPPLPSAPSLLSTPQQLISGAIAAATTGGGSGASTSAFG